MEDKCPYEEKLSTAAKDQYITSLCYAKLDANITSVTFMTDGMLWHFMLWTLLNV